MTSPPLSDDESSMTSPSYQNNESSSIDATLATLDLSPCVSLTTIHSGWLTGRKFQEIKLSRVMKQLKRLPSTHLGQLRSRLFAVVKAVASYTSKDKWVTLDFTLSEEDFRYELFSSADWDYCFSPLQSDQSLVAISVGCSSSNSTTMRNALYTQIGHLLTKSSTLETLGFGSNIKKPSGIYRMQDDRLSDEAVAALSEGLVQTKCLKSIVLERFWVDKQFVDILERGFTGNIQNTSLETIDLSGQLESLPMAFLALVSKYKSLKKILVRLDFTLKYDGIVNYGKIQRVRDGTVDSFRMVAESLRRWQETSFDTSREVLLNVELDFARVEYDVTFDPTKVEYEDRNLVSCCKEWLSAKDCGLKPGIQLVVRSYKFPKGWSSPWIQEIVKRSTQLMLFWGWPSAAFPESYPPHREGESSLCKSIQANDTLEFIDVVEGDSRYDNFWSIFFQCLHHKRRLKTLRIRTTDYRLSDKHFRSLMDLLHVNIYLEEISLFVGDRDDATPDERNVIVQEALGRNKEQAAYFSTLREAKLPFEQAKAARVFLCGHPHAGKITLRITMMKSRHQESRIIKYWKGKLGPLWRKSGSGREIRLKRTKGADVELLRDDDQMQISIWDLAGQEIFRALQSLLLPAVTQACVFVFLFSPFQDDHRHLKEHLEDAFRLELRSWLRFVASHYPITGTFLPKALVVISHKDKMKQYGRDLGCEFARIVDNFRAEYERALSLQGTPYNMDGWNEKEVGPFVDDLLVLVSEMLSKKTPDAPSLCYRLITEILNPQHSSSRQLLVQPVVRTPDFWTHVCSKRIELRSFDQTVENDKKVLEAIFWYMHDVGSIFYIPKCKLVVGDINWFTHKFLGLLVSEGHGFQVKPFSPNSLPKMVL